MSKRTVGGREKETIYGGADAGEEFVPPEADGLTKNIRCFIDVNPPYPVKKSNCPFVIETALD